nr:orotidine-5'-phosphate decarboxylase [Parasphaerochaeta coccoides]
MTYRDILNESARRAGNCACVGLDPRPGNLPRKIVMDAGDHHGNLVRFFSILLKEAARRNLKPAAFKPNIGYWQCLDAPRKGDYQGSRALADVLDMVEELFPGVPVILDSKRGDIASSSTNYAHEAFNSWGAHAVTVSPYMGSDSVEPFASVGGRHRGVYVLNRTSNRGAQDFQGMDVRDRNDSGEKKEPLYMAVARRIVTWEKTYGGTLGAVVGATSPAELGALASFYADHEIPLLIPGVGSQGAGATDTVSLLRDSGYPVELARINSSSGITMPWKDTPAPDSWEDMCMDAWSRLLEETVL